MLLIDEFNYLPENRLVEFVTYCSSLIVPSDGKPLVIIATAGTLPGKIGDIFTQSRCPSTYIRLTALSMVSMVNTLNIKEINVRKEMYKVLLDCCGVPRLFNTLRNSRPFPSTYEDGISLLLNAGNIPLGTTILKEMINRVISYSLLEIPIDLKTQEWDDYTSQGYAFLFPSPYNSLVLVAKFPLYWINKNKHFLKQMDPIRRIIKSIYFSQSDIMDGNQFELLACQWLSLKSYIIPLLEFTFKSLSLYLGVVIKEDIAIKSHPVQLLKASNKLVLGFDSLVDQRTEKPIVIQANHPFLINGISYQDGIDCVQLLLDSDENPILIFYQFKLYSSATQAKNKLELSLEKSVKVIEDVLEWYNSKFKLEIKNYFYLAVANNCNTPILPNTFQRLIDNGLKYYFVQGQDCRKFMTSIICERHNIWTKGQRILINIACKESIELLPYVGSVIADNILAIRAENDFGHISSLDQLKLN